jgi:phosphatidylglycerol:prolipoprotein diacylglycerol transferase
VHTVILQSPGAVLKKLGPITVRWYGVMIALGFVCASFFAARLARRQNIDPEKITNLTLLCFIAGIIGSRLYFVALNWTSYINRPGDILATWQGGMSIHGGIIGGFIAFYLYCSFYKLPKRIVVDICATVLPLGQAVGRWGNFFNSEAFGTPVPTDFPIAVFIPPESRPARFPDASLFHATFLYESIWDFGIFALLYFFLTKKLTKYPGVCSLIYLALYNIGRLMIEPMRTDSIMAGQIPVPIIASAGMVVLAIALIPFLLKKDGDKQGSEGSEPENQEPIQNQ